MPVNLVLHHPHPPPLCIPLVRRRAEDMLLLRGYQGAEYSLVLIDDAAMIHANVTWRHRSGTTNVLAFPWTDDVGPERKTSSRELGDILISLDTACREAVAMGQSFHERLTRLMAHGFLHLLGLDHERSEQEAATMQEQEDEICSRLNRRRSPAMTTLAVNVDHVATLRQARGIAEPDPVLAAGICELAGASGIVVHLREDRRHIQERDVRLLRQTIHTSLNLEMAAVTELVELALDVRPDLVTLVPEKRQELTTEGGLDLSANGKKVGRTIARLQAATIPVSLFINPNGQDVRRALDLGAACVELHTGRYCEARNGAAREAEFTALAQSAEEAYELGLRVHAGHGLDYRNVQRVASLETVAELSIGHAIIARAVLVGLDHAVREMLTLVTKVPSPSP